MLVLIQPNNVAGRPAVEAHNPGSLEQRIINTVLGGTLALLPNGFLIDVALIPGAMCRVCAWVNWRYVERNGKRTKVPLGPSGWPASTTDRASWSSLAAVLNPSVPVDGIGFVFTGGIGPDGLCVGGIDLDDLNKRREGEVDDDALVRRKERAARIVHEARLRGAYLEVSPSGVACTSSGSCVR